MPSFRNASAHVWAVMLLSLVASCGGDSTSPPPVASVQMTSTNSNPRVGDVTHVSATPVTSGGIQIQGVTCSFMSGAPSVASVSATDGTVTAVSVGTAVITATCGGVSNSVTITVRPPLETLTLLSAGTGSGSIFATPAGGSYDQGSSVSISATPSTGSTFTGFSGGGCGTTSPCTVVMNTNLSVTANFALGETFANATAFGGSQSSVSDPSPPGCTYSVSISVTSMTLVLNSATTGTGTATYTVTVTATGQTGSGTCSGNPYTETSTGNLTVSGSSISGSLTHTSTTYGTVNQTLTISATRSGSTITGTVNSATVLRNGAGTAFNSSGGPFSFTLTKQ